MSLTNPGGSVFVNADAAIGRSGVPVRIYNATWLSGATAGDLVLRNGTGDSDQIYVNAVGTVNQTATLNWQSGLFFPDGCFFDKDTNLTSAVIAYEVAGPQ